MTNTRQGIVLRRSGSVQLDDRDVIRMAGQRPRGHIMTVAVEDYFQSRAFEDLIDRRQWSRFEGRVEQNTLAALDLLDRYQARATFFFTTWVAEKHPALAREVIRRGHEVASSGDSQRSFRKISPSDFAREACQSREVLESITGIRVRGFRVADYRLTPKDLWALRILAEHGYDYDSSIHPSLFAFRQQPWRRVLHQEKFDERTLWEVPLSSISTCGVEVPVAGGNWFRQLPESFVKRAVHHWTATCNAPFVMYYRVWDFDSDQPVITAASGLSRLRHYRNPGKVPRLIESFLATYRFTSIADYLEFVPEASHPSHLNGSTADLRSSLSVTATDQTSVTIVIPCYNEEKTLPYLANTLRDLKKVLGAYDLRFVLVDDGSLDRTYQVLQSLFGGTADCELIRMPTNRGVAAAILTGIRHANTEIVCSMDCDCTYDPHELANMIPMLQTGIDMVTASPYHPSGRVAHVPGWRLVLSKSCSYLYRCVLRQRLYTYTSCFRVYRRSAVLPIELRQTGFLGVAELLGRLDLNGSRIAEYPTTLEVRMLGYSKMRIMKTILGHINLIIRFALTRWFSQTHPLNPADPIVVNRQAAQKECAK